MIGRLLVLSTAPQRMVDGVEVANHSESAMNYDGVSLAAIGRGTERDPGVGEERSGAARSRQDGACSRSFAADRVDRDSPSLRNMSMLWTVPDIRISAVCVSIGRPARRANQHLHKPTFATLTSTAPSIRPWPDYHPMDVSDPSVSAERAWVALLAALGSVRTGTFARQRRRT